MRQSNVLVAVVVVLIGGTADATDRLVPQQYPTIQAAIDAAVDGDTVVVQPGIYTSTHPGWVVDTKGKQLTLTSVDPNDELIVASTVIDGQYQRRGVSCHSGETILTVIRGFTIRNGYTVPYDYNNSGAITYDEAFGGNMSVRYCSVRVVKCNLLNGLGYNQYIGNAAAGYGSGIAMLSSSSIMEGCRFAGNTGGVVQCVVTCFWGAPTLTDCVITDNQGYGVFAGQAGLRLTMTRCQVLGNTGSGVVVNYANNYESILTDCVIAGNDSTGVSAYLSKVSLHGCSVHDNVGGYSVNTSFPGTIATSQICGNAQFQVSGNWVDGGANLISDLCQDSDGDGVLDGSDNCPTTPNPIQEDCNADGMGDVCEIASGAASDFNSNGLPDNCECLGDISGNGAVNGVDLAALLSAWGTSGKSEFDCDIDDDGTVSATDLAFVLGGWGPCSNW